ncbi:MAG: hypothetical protein WC216_05460 [Gallionella sp.]|jgi:hypothetical protein
MFGMESLDVMIGIITIYLIFALACTAIVEAYSAWRDVRSKNLEVALKEFLHGQNTDGGQFVDAFFAHPIVQTLSVGEHGRPSYITPEIVGQVVASLINKKEGDSPLRTGIAMLPGTILDNRIKGLLDALYGETGENLAAFRKLIENHYDEAMDRASGWYKRKTQLYALVISAFLVIFANVDTVSLANSLSSNPAARAKMVELAQKTLDAAKTTDSSTKTTTPDAQDPGAPAINAGDRAAAETLAKAYSNLSSAGIQLGWKDDYPDSLGAVISKIFGLLVSILAISLGAPFWFDILNRVMQVRAAGASPREKSKT